MNLDDIIESINDKVNFDLRDRKRTLDYVGARCIYYDLAYNHFSLGTLSDIASHIGRDHTTAVHSLNKLLPTLNLYFPKMAQIRRDIVGHSDDINEIFNMIKSVPDDKTSILKTRLEPIIYMLCK